MKLLDFIRSYKWDLGIALEAEGHRFNSPKWDFHIVKAPKNKWYADPFILDVTDDNIIVLVEEFTYSINQGRLAKLVIDKNTYKVKSEKIILSLTTHLSFPAILRIGNQIFIYPENSESGKSIIYQYNSKDDSLVETNTLSDLPLTDAIITEIDGNNYLFATKIPKQNKNELAIYTSKERIGHYNLHQVIFLNDNTARGAGDIFVDGNKLIRPAQNCNGGYGIGLVFQEVIKDKNDSIELRELFRKLPIKKYTGMHTYNKFKGYAIVDLHARRHPFLYRVSYIIKNVLKLFFKNQWKL